MDVLYIWCCTLFHHLDSTDELSLATWADLRRQLVSTVNAQGVVSTWSKTGVGFAIADSAKLLGFLAVPLAS